ncbi:IclR family transcriptional regulator [Acinetobacter baumannii]|jgi:DNA-binding IclR family transcriptional regulator|uniref:Helix-turn-helix domain-containing protein n=1 Tax=Acinetobacter baumannii TaxID=470 RepID=A0A333HLX4_ACIBA|nr:MULTISPECIES: IclR family transcriptional regulator [Acinetobacter calcoaceticus/baumannii complex]EJB8494385.1 IclR family transcriptional regulator [Acinetobacter baumannii]ELB0343120.1 IclR family transcriptional regulator [Acinetobacter baumannii]EMC7949637.1 IclR family transcriptional regulator [Acinetobacter baumannii]EMD9690991.1 IclR family transcriptional regulator [Acinetobacter baumannii]EXA59630.1 bacterial transcriptional regulator family protein [Acinetobacter baumannii 10351
MTVKLVARALDLIEVFAHYQRPLVLSELAAYLDIPPSSCLSMVRTMIDKGYLYEVKRRGGYYPTRKLETQAAKIHEGNQILEVIHEHLVRLQKEVGESIVLGKIQDDQVIYLDVLESNQVIRYAAQIGDLRPLHANSISKSILAQHDDEYILDKLLNLKMTKYSEQTISSPREFLNDLEEVRKNGFSSNLGESAEDLAAIAMPLNCSGEWYGISIVGPLNRMKKLWTSHPKALSKCIELINEELKEMGAQ